MDRLNDPPNLMIVSDLDGTMVDHDDPGSLALLRFNALWEAYYRHNSLLVFSTGRSPTSFRSLRKKKPLLTPDITIMSVGTEIAYGESIVPDDVWKQYLDNNWDRKAITEETAKFPELIPQPETENRSHKVSFYVEKGKVSEVILALSKCLEKRRLDVKIIYSNGTALDILPQGAGKGQALAYILEKFKADGKGPINTLVCGDSGNDAELFSVPDVYGVMVSNSLEELLHWYVDNAKSNPKIIHATERCSAGIIQAIGHFSIGPNVSPRDITEKSAGKVFNPGHEVVKFYIFYERWRCGKVENSEQNLQTLKSTIHHAGSFLHPSGVEQNRHQILDTFEKSYGDKQGIRFQVWVDCVSFAEISLGSWQVKFDKWEISGNELQGCSTKVLMNSKVLIYSPDGRCLLKYQPYESGLGVKSVSWSPCGQFLAVGSYDQMLRVLNHLTWKTFAELMHPSTFRGPCYATVFKEVDEPLQLDMSELCLNDDFSHGNDANVLEAPFRVRYEAMEVPINLPFQKPPAEKPNPKQGIGLLSVHEAIACLRHYGYEIFDISSLLQS